MWLVVNICLLAFWIDRSVLMDENLSELDKEEAVFLLTAVFGQLIITGYLLF